VHADLNTYAASNRFANGAALAVSHDATNSSTNGAALAAPDGAAPHSVTYARIEPDGAAHVAAYTSKANNCSNLVADDGSYLRSWPVPHSGRNNRPRRMCRLRHWKVFAIVSGVELR